MRGGGSSGLKLGWLSDRPGSSVHVSLERAEVAQLHRDAQRGNVGAIILSSDASDALVKKVAVFGNAGGGKSRLARRLAELSGLPLYVVDMIQFRPGGAKVPHNEFLQAHADLLRCDE